MAIDEDLLQFVVEEVLGPLQGSSLYSYIVTTRLIGEVNYNQLTDEIIELIEASGHLKLWGILNLR
jgi:hypothetical protein